MLTIKLYMFWTNIEGMHGTGTILTLLKKHNSTYEFKLEIIISYLCILAFEIDCPSLEFQYQYPESG